jgi:acyl dehydratase
MILRIHDLLTQGGEVIYYEDMVPGGSQPGPSLTVERDELVNFARAWDPLAIHVDEAAALAHAGGITAPGLYMLALKQRLINRLAERHAVIASLGYDEVRFLGPVRPGDTLRLGVEWITRRPSASKPDRGIVTIRFSLVKADGAVVMTHLDTVLVRRAPPN